MAGPAIPREPDKRTSLKIIGHRSEVHDLFDAASGVNAKLARVARSTVAALSNRFRPVHGNAQHIGDGPLVSVGRFVENVEFARDRIADGHHGTAATIEIHRLPGSRAGASPPQVRRNSCPRPRPACAHQPPAGSISCPPASSPAAVRGWRTWVWCGTATPSRTSSVLPPMTSQSSAFGRVRFSIVTA